MCHCSQIVTLLQGQTVSVAMSSVAPLAFKDASGSLIGTDADSIELLKDFVEFNPKYVFARTFDESVLMVHNGSVDLGLPVTITPYKYQLVDLTSILKFITISYVTRVPQPQDVLYQFLLPFETSVWIVWISILVLFGILIYMVTRFTKTMGFNLPLQDVKLMDYPIFSIGMTIQPLISEPWIDLVRSRELQIENGSVLGLFCFSGDKIFFLAYNT